MSGKRFDDLMGVRNAQHTDLVGHELGNVLALEQDLPDVAG